MVKSIEVAGMKFFESAALKKGKQHCFSWKIMVAPIFLFTLHSHSFSGNIDSLRIMMSQKNGKEKAILCNRIGSEYYRTIPDSGIFYAQKALDLALKLNDKKDASDACQIMGQCQFSKNNPEKAEKLFLQAYNLRKEINNKELMAASLMSLSALYKSLNSPDKALEYCLESYKTKNPVKDEDKAKYYSELAWIYHSLGQPKKSIEYCEKALPIFINAGNEDFQNGLYQLLGIIYQDFGLYEKSITNYKKCIEIQEKHNDSAGMAYNLNNIGGIYYKYFSTEIANDYTSKALSIFRKMNNRRGIGYVLNGRGQNFSNAGKYDSALVCFFEALPNMMAANDLQSQAFILGNIGDTYLSKGDETKAEAYLKLSLDKSILSGDKFSICCNYCSLGKLLRKKKDNKMALQLLNKGLVLAHKISLIEKERDCYYEIAQIYLTNKDFKNGFYNYRRYSELNDSIFHEKSLKVVAEYQTKYETEKKEKEIVRLAADNVLKNIDLQKKTTWIWLLSIGSIFLIISALIVTYFYVQRDKAYKKIVLMNLEVVKAEKKLMEDKQEIISFDLQEVAGRHEKQFIADEVSRRISEDVIRYLVYEKNYLNPELTLADLAEALKTNTTYLSRVLNESLGHNFVSFLNELRIKEARQLLSEEKYRNISIEGIAQTVGFNSKSAFYTAFKRFTGVTPTFYLKSLKTVLIDQSTD